MAKTKTFEGKTIYLIKDIDFNNDNSYQNPNDTTFGDINGNGTIEGLKVELTTEKGFYPIGSSSVPFKGLFEGYAKSISNLMINRSQDNVGLFGYNQGTIRGFTISSNISGNNNVGGVVGYNAGGTINEIIYQGIINVTSYGAGGIAGYSNGGNIKSVLIKNADVTSNQGTGGILGYGTSVTLTGIIEGGTVTGNQFPGIIAGRNSNGSYNAYYASGRISGTTGNNNGGGTAYVLRDEILNAYDKVLDTYIGGDNDNSGYYFDYESDDSSNIVIKRTTKNPIKFTLKGKGTESEPYIIDNYNHFKEATTLVGDGNSYNFKLTNDIDFNEKHYYALGTNGNTFNSDIDGDMHTLSNITFNCAENCGLISQNSHTIEGLNLSNITIISGNDNVGSLVGNNTGTIKGINASDISINASANAGGIVGYNSGGIINDIIYEGTINVTGYGAGGIAGYSNGGTIKSVLIRDANITSNQGTGGIVGYGKNITLAGIIEGGTVSGTHFPGIIAGRDSSGSFNGHYASGRISGNTGNYNGGGTAYVLRDEILNAYDIALDTYIGGDNDNSGYYFDYESDTSSNIILKRTKDYPITFTLVGAGTSSDPYLIDSYQHFKEATIRSNGNYVFKLINDIDFNGKHYYALGTNGNILGSDINGDMHTLSNITFNCADNCGLISQNSHTIEGLNLDGITITSGNNNIGGLVGVNTGMIKGINASNVALTGNGNVGGIVGNNSGTVNEIAISSNVEASGSNCGGVVGTTSNNSNIKSVLVKAATVKSSSGTGGILGYGTGVTLTGVIEGGTVTGNHFPGIIAGRNSTGSFIGYYASGRISGTTGNYNGGGTAYTLIPPTTVTYSNTEIDSLTYYNNVGVLDTVINGDDDNSGYYLQYNNSADSIVVVKAGTTSNPSNPGSAINTSSPVPIIGESVGDNPPTCVLNEVIPRSAGLQAVLTCEDEEGAPTIRSQWNVNKNAVTNQFSDTGIIKEGTVNGNSKTVRPYWSTSNTISVPTPNTCYYYRFGAMDASGNWSYYVTDQCYYGFSS